MVEDEQREVVHSDSLTLLVVADCHDTEAASWRLEATVPSVERILRSTAVT